MEKVNGGLKTAEHVSCHVVSYHTSKMPKQIALSNTRPLLRNGSRVKTRGFTDSSSKVGIGQGPTLVEEYLNNLPFLK